MNIQYQINQLSDSERGKLCDGYHTFNDLYKHRNHLFAALLNSIEEGRIELSNCAKEGLEFDPILHCFKARRHHDGEQWEGWILCGIIHKRTKQQITYHLPEEYWEKLKYVQGYGRAPVEFDGHTSDDVLVRLEELFLS